jgi:hypothetical protein
MISDPTPFFAAQLIIMGFDGAQIGDLIRVLKGPLSWSRQPFEDQTDKTNIWLSTVGDWRLTLADYSVEDQPGHKPGDRGQTLALSGAKLVWPVGLSSAPFALMGTPGQAGCGIAGDSILLHELGRWLLERMETGTGKTGAARRAAGGAGR